MFERLGPALRQLREQAGLSQRELARRCRVAIDGCRVTQAMLSQWERGAQLPGLSQLGQVLEGLGVSLLDLHGALRSVESRRHPAAVTEPHERPVPVAQLLARELEAIHAHLRRLDRRLEAELSTRLIAQKPVLKPAGDAEVGCFSGGV